MFLYRLQPLDLCSRVSPLGADQELLLEDLLDDSSGHLQHLSHLSRHLLLLLRLHLLRLLEVPASKPDDVSVANNRNL